MSHIMKSVENSQVQPLQPKKVKRTDYHGGNIYNSPLGAFIWFGIAIGGFTLLASISTEKGVWLLLLLSLLSFAVATAVIFLIKKIDTDICCNNMNKKYEQESVNEAKNITNNIRSYVRSSTNSIASLEKNISRTYELIHQANIEYKENAYSPFWDKIHEAIEQVTACQKNIYNLSEYAKLYSDSLEGRQHDFPQFPITNELVPDLSIVSNDLHKTIRKGQTNFEFSSIYEQRRTREVMIAGFKSLGEAVDNFGDSIDRTMTNFVLQLNHVLNQTK